MAQHSRRSGDGPPIRDGGWCAWRHTPRYQVRVLPSTHVQGRSWSTEGNTAGPHCNMCCAAHNFVANLCTVYIYICCALITHQWIRSLSLEAGTYSFTDLSTERMMTVMWPCYQVLAVCLWQAPCVSACTCWSPTYIYARHRYMWYDGINKRKCNIYNSNNLPAAPFREFVPG